MKEFLGKNLTRKVKFMDGEVEVKELTVADVKNIEAETKKLEDNEDQIEALHYILRLAVVGAEELTDEEIDSLPIAELTKLSEEIMGVNRQEGND